MGLVKEKFILIGALEQFDHVFLPTRLYQHSILNTIDLDVLLDIFKERDCPFRKILNYNLSRRIKLSTNKGKYFDWLFEQIDNSDYVTRLRLRMLLDILAPDMDFDNKKLYFNYFVLSKYIHEVNAAIKFSINIWSKEIEEFLIEAYIISPNYLILKILEEKKSWKSLEKILKFTWNVVNSKRYKSFFTRNFHHFQFKTLTFLKNCDSDNYLNALIKHKKNVSNDEAIEYLAKSDDEGQAYTIWRLSNLNKWGIIEPEILKFIEKNQNNT